MHHLFVDLKGAVDQDLSKEFKTDAGVRQGDALACLLFNLVKEMTIRNRQVQQLTYADDIEIIAGSECSLQENDIGK